jgi:hypothetical protein
MVYNSVNNMVGIVNDSYNGKKFSELIHTKIKEHTGLDDELAFWYRVFIDSSSISDGLVLSSAVKSKIRGLMTRLDASNPSEDPFTKMDAKTLDNMVENSYDFILDSLIDYRLLDKVSSSSGKDYPRIVGYNYLNDTELYVAYRSKGETNWTGRFPTPRINFYEVQKILDSGCEFKDDLMRVILD